MAWALWGHLVLGLVLGLPPGLGPGSLFQALFWTNGLGPVGPPGQVPGLGPGCLFQALIPGHGPVGPNTGPIALWGKVPGQILGLGPLLPGALRLDWPGNGQRTGPSTGPRAWLYIPGPKTGRWPGPIALWAKVMGLGLVVYSRP